MSEQQKVSVKASALLAYLSGHIGRANGVGVKHMAAWFGWTPRDVRLMVTELRERGHAICAHPSVGYWIAETPEEIDEACAFLHSRAMRSLSLIARIKKVALPDLIGQLKLRT